MAWILSLSWEVPSQQHRTDANSIPQPLEPRHFQRLAKSIVWTLPKGQSTYESLILIRYHSSVLPEMTSTRSWFRLSWLTTHIIPGQMLMRTFGMNLARYTLRPAPLSLSKRKKKTRSWRYPRDFLTRLSKR